jgi:hypothetical protein
VIVHTTHDKLLHELALIQGHLRTAGTALRLREYKTPGSDAWEALSAEVLKEASIARAELSGVLDAIAEEMCHDTNKLGRAIDNHDVPDWVNGGRR